MHNKKPRGLKSLHAMSGNRMYWMISDWPWTLNCQKYPCKFSFVLLYSQRFSRYNIAENEKYTKWPQNDLEYWTVKTTLCLSTPEFHISLSFALRRAIFQIKGCQKSEMHRITADWPWTLNCQKYLVYIEYLAPKAQISLCFARRWLFFKIIAALDFPVCYNGECEMSCKYLKIRNPEFSKIPNSTFVRSIQWEENSGAVCNNLKDIWFRVYSLVSTPFGVDTSLHTSMCCR